MYQDSRGARGYGAQDIGSYRCVMPVWALEIPLYAARRLALNIAEQGFLVQ